MPRINLDPSLDEPPVFTSAPYQALHTLLTINDQRTDEEAAAILLQSWQTAKDERLQLWREQLEADQIQAEAEQAERQLAKDTVEAAMRSDLLKKRSKLPDFNDNVGAPDVIPCRPSPFAIAKIAAHEYVDLWYFTPEGCQLALDAQRSTTDDTFGITKVDDTIALRSVSSVHASRHVIKDQHLTFRQMSLARLLMVDYMITYEWPQRHVEALISFFLDIESSLYRTRERGEEILLIHQAEV
jgi:hypothetical protein